jgi:hypothetical protein
MDNSPYNLNALQALSELMHPFIGPPDFSDAGLRLANQELEPEDEGAARFHYIDIDRHLPSDVDLKAGDSIVLVKVLDSHFKAIHGEETASHALRALVTPPEFELRDISESYLFPLPGQPDNTYCIRRLEAVTLGRGELELTLSLGNTTDAPKLPARKIDFTIV